MTSGAMVVVSVAIGQTVSDEQRLVMVQRAVGLILLMQDQARYKSHIFTPRKITWFQHDEAAHI